MYLHVIYTYVQPRAIIRIQFTHFKAKLAKEIDDYSLSNEKKDTNILEKKSRMYIPTYDLKL